MLAKLLNKNLTLSALLLLIGLFNYSNSFSNAFHIDDGNRLIHNEAIRRVSPISRHFFNPSTNSDIPDLIQYRPWVPLTFSINYYYSNLKVESYRISNFIFLGICSILVFYLVFLLLDITESTLLNSQKKLIAFFTALIFFIHPISGVSVNYISARDILLMELFFICALISYINSQRKNNLRTTYRALSYFFLICSLFAKKNALVFPFIILFYDLIVSRKNKAPFKTFLSFSSICLAFMLMIKYALDFSDITNTNSYTRNYFSYAISQTKVHLHYLYSYINPQIIRPFPELNLPNSLWNIEVILGLVTILGSISLAIYLRKKHALISWCILSYWLLLAPTSSVYPLIHEAMPYRPFPSILFLSLILVLSFTKILKPKNTLLILLLLSSILLKTSIQTNKVWKTPQSLWTHTLNHGGNSRAYLSFAVGVIPNNRLDLKEKYFLKALEKDPSYIFASMLYGKMLVQDNRIDKGLIHLKKAVKTKPNSSSAHFYLSKGLEAKGDLKSALRSAKMAKTLAPSSEDYSKAYENLKAKLKKNPRTNLN